MAHLTRREKMLLAFVLSAFVLGAGIKHWRESRAVTELAAR